MIIRASGRPALILAAGLFACFAGVSPVTAADADSTATASKSDSATVAKPAKQGSRHSKQDENRKAASKSSDTGKAAGGDVADAAGGTPSAMPAWVANAHAQVTPDAPADNANGMAMKANTLLTAEKPAEAQSPADAQVVASDQLNDLDRALQQQNQSEPAAQAPSPPSAQPQPQPVAMAIARPAPALASSDSSTWDQTSLIGKIFIAFGALLTMASAARMLIA